MIFPHWIRCDYGAQFVSACENDLNHIARVFVASLARVEKEKFNLHGIDHFLW